jgi:hypothetical protein
MQVNGIEIVDKESMNGQKLFLYTNIQGTRIKRAIETWRK